MNTHGSHEGNQGNPGNQYTYANMMPQGNTCNPCNPGIQYMYPNMIPQVQQGNPGIQYMYPNMMPHAQQGNPGILGNQYIYPNMIMQQQANMMMMQQQANMMMMQPQQQPMMMMQPQQQQQPMMMMQPQQQPQPMMMMQPQPMMMMQQPIINKQPIIQKPIEIANIQSKIKKPANKKPVKGNKRVQKGVQKGVHKGVHQELENEQDDQDDQDDQVDMQIEYMQASMRENIPLIDRNVDNDQILINQFNNVNLINKDKSKKKSHNDINFKQWDDGRNIIKTLKPINNEEAHFNTNTHPNEIYIVEFMTGTIENIKANDINNCTLEAYHIIHKHNISMTQDNIQIKGSAVIYVRCSSENDISIDTQIKGCLDYAKLQGFILTGVYIDNGMSGRKGHNLKKGELGYWTQYFLNGTNLLIYSIDRLTRHLLSGITYIDTLMQRQIDTHFVSNKIIYNKMISSMHKSMVQQELQTAEKYSNDTSEKIKGTLKRLKDQGSIIGGRIPYGTKRIIIDGIRKQIPNTTELENIKTIKNKFYKIWKNYDKYSHLIKNKTNFQIIKYLTNWCNENHIKYRNNISFTHSQIQTLILKNKN